MKNEMRSIFTILFLSFLFLIPFVTNGQEDTIAKKLPRIKPIKFSVDKRITSLKIDTANGILSWTTVNEYDTSFYIVEELRWNKVYCLGKVKKVVGKKSNYSIHVPVDSGIYVLRIKSGTGEFFKGKDIKVPQPKEDVYCPTVDARDRIFFSRRTKFEVYDKFGKIIKTGFDNYVFTGDLEGDVYYLNYGNNTTEFIIKKRK